MNSYDFMDLLKDKGHVPEIIDQELSIIEDFENSINEVVDFFEAQATDYDFLDLLQDKGYGRLPIASNDNAPVYSAVSAH